MNLGSIAASALNTFSIDMHVRAHNIANVSTGGYTPLDTSYMTLPDNQGVAIASIYNAYAPSSPQPSVITVNENGRESYAPGILEGSHVNIAHEFVHMVATQRAFEANAAVIRTHDDISGTVLDLKV